MLRACTNPAAEALDVRHKDPKPRFWALLEGLVKLKKVMTNDMSTVVRLETTEVAPVKEW